MRSLRLLLLLPVLLVATVVNSQTKNNKGLDSHKGKTVELKTMGKTRIFINREGLVGIGNVKPVAALDLGSGSLRISELVGNGNRLLMVGPDGTVQASNLKTGPGGGTACIPVLDGWGIEPSFANILKLCGPYDVVEIGNQPFVSVGNLPSLVLDARGDVRVVGDLAVLSLSSGGPVFADVNGKLTISPQGNFSTQWSTNGNNLLIGQYLGSNNAQDLVLKTNSVERMRISTGGIIGINTNSLIPNVRLQLLAQPGDQVAFCSVARFNTGFKYGMKSVVDRDDTKAIAVINETLVSSSAPDGEDVFRVYGNGLMESKAIGVNANNLIPGIRFQLVSDPGDQVAFCSVARFNTGFKYGIKSVVNHNDTKAIAVINENLTSPNAPNGEDVFRVYGNGHLETRSIKIHLTNWSDHVFDSDYNLRSLEDLEQFILKNHHLPNIPSEKEALRDGDNLGEMDALLLEKIEELSLYIIQ